MAAAIGCGRLGFGGGDNLDAELGVDLGIDAPDLLPGMLLWLRMEDDLADRLATDSSGSGNHAPCSATYACPTQISGRSGMAMNGFTPTTAPGLEIADASQWRFANVFTLTAWVKLANVAPTNNVVIAKPFGSANANSYQLEVLADGTVRCAIEGGGYFDATTTVTVPLDTWLHLTCTYDGQLRLYVDGALMAGPVAGTAIAYDTHSVYVGCDRNMDAPASAFDGELDDVGIFDRALSESEIATLRQQ
jgi:hypothetical protein